MTKPVEVFEGDTLMMTRKVTEDWFLLKPTPSVKRLIGYIALYWAERLTVEVLAIIILSNHIHIIYRHPLGNGPLFCQMFEHWVARIMNVRLHRTGCHFFAPGPCRPMRCPSAEDIEAKLDYVVTNAPRHGLCPRAYDWPGLLFGPEQAGEPVEYDRPPELAGSKVFPPKMSLIVPAPHHLRSAPVEFVRAKFEARRKQTESHVAEQRHGQFMGVDRAMTVPTFSRPKKVKSSHFKPFFSTSDPELLAELKRSRAIFLKSHDARLDSFRAGDLTSNWPPGTYKMRRTYGLPPP